MKKLGMIIAVCFLCTGLLGCSLEDKGNSPKIDVDKERFVIFKKMALTSAREIQKFKLDPSAKFKNSSLTPV